eukprot:252856-Rhodomonas_salina.3
MHSLPERWHGLPGSDLACGNCRKHFKPLATYVHFPPRQPSPTAAGVAHRLAPKVCLHLSALILDDPGPELIVPAKEVSRKGGQAVLEYSRRIAVGWREGRLEGARLGLKGLPIEVMEMKGAVWKLSLVALLQLSCARILRFWN